MIRISKEELLAAWAAARLAAELAAESAAESAAAFQHKALIKIFGGK